jgi:iron complex outermembrane receptor protein
LRRNKIIEFIKIISIIIPLNTAVLTAQDTITFVNFEDQITVVASRIPTSLPLVARSVMVIDEKEIKKMPVQSVQELLKYIPSIDLQQRGPVGVQADLSIRGSTYEQTLLLVNGIRISDPQTGHHNLNIPYSLDDIERLEILRGPGSRIYGPNAFGGVVNIILKEGKERNVSVHLSGGDYHYYQGEASAELPYKNFYSRLSVSKSGSDGYRESTDFNILNFSSDFSYIKGKNRINLSASWLDKQFGANSFYTPAFPNQWEEVKTLFMQMNWTYQNRKILIKPIISWRKGNDDFLLKRDNPNFYHNTHETNVYHAEIQSQYTSEIGVTTVSLDRIYENINSNNLGKHDRNTLGGSIEHQFSIEKSSKIIAGISAYDYSKRGLKFWPGVDFIHEFTSNLRMHISVNKAFRIPTFTELYYSSPVNVGNKDLQSEVSLSYELGANYLFGAHRISSAVFRRLEDHLIDWILNPENNVWYAQNLSKAVTNGFELGWQINTGYIFSKTPITNIHLNYTFLDRDIDHNNLISKYVLNYLHHQLLLNIEHTFFLNGLYFNWNFRYADRVNADKYFITDFKISYKLNQFRFFATANNLFNTDYYEVQFIPMPGRWIKGGFIYNFKLN